MGTMHTNVSTIIIFVETYDFILTLYHCFVCSTDADGKSVESVKSGLGYTEEIILDLCSSTEELNFHDLTESEIRRRRSKLQPQYAVFVYIYIYI